MKTKAGAAATDEDGAKPAKIRSSRSKRRHGRRSRSRSSSVSGSPVRRRSKKPSKKIADKKSSKRSKVSSSSRRSRHRRHRSLSSDRSSPSSISPSSVSRSYSHLSSSSTGSSERSVSPPPRSRSKDVRKRKGRGRDRDRAKDRKRSRKARRSRSCTSSSSSSGSSRSRSRSKNRRLRVGSSRDRSNRDKIAKEYDNSHASRSEKNVTEDGDRDEEALAVARKENNEIDGYKKDMSLKNIDSPPSKDAIADETGNVLPAGDESPAAEDLELILRQKALENFRKFRQAATMAGKADNNGATGNKALTDSLQNGGTEIAEASPAAVAPIQRLGSSLGVRYSVESPRLMDCENGTSHYRKQDGSVATSHGAGSPKRILEDGVTGGSTTRTGGTAEETHSTSQLRSPQGGRDRRGVMQRLAGIPGSSANQRLGSSIGAVSHVNWNPNPRIRSVVSIPSREGTPYAATSPRPCESSVPVESSSKVGNPLADIDKAQAQGSNEDKQKTTEAPASNDSILSPNEEKSEVRIEDKDGSQFQKKTFSRMHDGETVEVSYKVYIPKKTPALARRKLQR